MNNEQPTHLDLFSGIGGFALAAAWAGFRTVAFCEIEPYCQAVLKARFGATLEDSRWREQQKPSHPIKMPSEWHSEKRPADSACGSSGNGSSWTLLHRDIFTLDGTQYAGVSLLTGGFPCQPFSCAGKRAGSSDDRFLWPEMLRVIAEARPAWVLGENVAGIINMELDRVLSDLENIGYAVWPIVIPAVAVDAKHRRDRVWIVAHTGSGGWEQGGPEWRGKAESRSCDESGQPCCNAESLANISSAGLQGEGRNRESTAAFGSGGTVALWEPEPDVGRVASGVPNRVDRLKGLGNAIVPAVAFEILKAIRLTMETQCVTNRE